MYGGPEARAKWLADKAKPVSVKLVLRPAINDLDDSPMMFELKVRV